MVLLHMARPQLTPHVTFQASSATPELVYILFHWWGCSMLHHCQIAVRVSKHLLPVSGLVSLWSSNIPLQTCTSLVTTLGSAGLRAQVQNLVLGQLLLRVSIWVERALYMRNSCVTVVARKSLLCFRLLQNHRAALSSPFWEQKSIHRGKFVVISFGEHFLL